MLVLGIVVLPGHMMPLGVSNPRVIGYSHDPLGTFPGMKIHQCLTWPGAQEMDTRCHAAVGRIMIREVEFPDTPFRIVVTATDVPIVKRLVGAVHLCAMPLDRSSPSHPGFHCPFLRACLQVQLRVAPPLDRPAVFAMPHVVVGEPTHSPGPRHPHVSAHVGPGQGKLLIAHPVLDQLPIGPLPVVKHHGVLVGPDNSGITRKHPKNQVRAVTKSVGVCDLDREGHSPPHDRHTLQSTGVGVKRDAVGQRPLDQLPPQRLGHVDCFQGSVVGRADKRRR